MSAGQLQRTIAIVSNDFLVEPFDLTNTARSVYDGEVFESIKQVFYVSWCKLRDTYDLKSVFSTVVFKHPLHPSLQTPTPAKCKAIGDSQLL